MSRPIIILQHYYPLRGLANINMIPVRGYAAQRVKSPLSPYSFKRRNPRDHDIPIDIQYCGICHSDIHQVRNDWGGSSFPLHLTVLIKEV